MSDQDVSARQAHDNASSYLKEADFAQAFIWGMRYLVLSLDERDVVRATPGLTAHEAATAASAQFPDSRDSLVNAAALFDAVLYGRSTPTRDDVTRLMKLTKALRTSRTSSGESLAGDPPSGDSSPDGSVSEHSPSDADRAPSAQGAK